MITNMLIYLLYLILYICAGIFIYGVCIGTEKPDTEYLAEGVFLVIVFWPVVAAFISVVTIAYGYLKYRQSLSLIFPPALIMLVVNIFNAGKTVGEKLRILLEPPK